MKFKQYAEAKITDVLKGRMKPKVSWGEILRTAMNVVPGLGFASDVIHLVKNVIENAKANKDMSREIARLMMTPDSKRPRGLPNPFDLDDDISAMLSNEAILEIAKQLQEEMGRYNFDPDSMPDNLANTVAAHYVRSMIGKYLRM